MSMVEELQRATSDIVRGVGPGVVRIGRGPGRGSGFVVADGAVLTNAHNLRGKETTVTFPDGRREVGPVAGVDAGGDLAVIRVDSAGAPVPAWAEDEPGVGTPVFAVTTPPGDGTRVTFGTVSAVGRPFRGPRGRLISGGLEHTAPLARGSSGGPVVDVAGRVVGVNTHRLGEGLYLAVPPSTELRRQVEALVRGESPRRPYLGVALAPPAAGRRLRASVGLEDRDGLLVRGVDERGPAAAAGVRTGDLLVEAGGQALLGADDLFAVLGRLGPDDTLDLRVVRGVEEREVRVTLSPEGGAGEGSGTA